MAIVENTIHVHSRIRTDGGLSSQDGNDCRKHFFFVYSDRNEGGNKVSQCHHGLCGKDFLGKTTHQTAGNGLDLRLGIHNKKRLLRTSSTLRRIPYSTWEKARPEWRGNRETILIWYDTGKQGWRPSQIDGEREMSQETGFDRLELRSTATWQYRTANRGTHPHQSTWWPFLSLNPLHTHALYTVMKSATRLSSIVWDIPNPSVPWNGMWQSPSTACIAIEPRGTRLPDSSFPQSAVCTATSLLPLSNSIRQLK